MRPTLIAVLAALLAALGSYGPSEAQAQKYGGILRSAHRANPPSLSIHEESTFNTSWPMTAVYSNVVYFDAFKPNDALDTVVPDLAASWKWSADNTRLTFKLHQGVKWHDGKPFSARDVKHTFDMVRGASQQRMKLNPRRAWYKNVKEITTSGDNEVTFSLGRPQPGLVMLLASTYSPVYPAHIPAAELRTKAVGTGAFRLTEYVRDQHLRVRKNADYFVKGRPYLDGVDYIIIKSKGTALAVMTSGQVDVFLPTETEQKTYETLKKNPELVFQRRALGTNNQHMIVNSRKPPFNDPRLRKAVNLALDRYAYTRSIQPGYQVGGYMLGPPDGDWGYGADELRSMPGWRDAALDKEDARKLMREMGYSERNPLKFTLSTRTPANYVEPAQWIIGELKQVYFSPELEIVDDGQWYPRLARRDYTISLAAHGYGANDPDVPYYEGFSCGSQRNYVDYCDPEAEKLFELQSRTVDQVERAKIVRQIELKLIGEAVKPSLAFRVDYNATNKRVKDFIPHSGAYSYGRMQEVWLDR